MLPDAKRIVDVVYRFYGVKNDEITMKRRGRKNEARNAAIYLTRKLRVDTFKAIGDHYGIDNERTVRSVCVRMSKALSDDKDLAGKMKKLKNTVEKS